MKLSLLQHPPSTRRSASFRAATTSPSDPTTADSAFKSIFCLLIHALCCLISLVLGFRFSRVVFFLLFSTISDHQTLTLLTSPSPPSLPSLDAAPHKPITSRVVVGRHGIRIRPWPHPNPAEVMKAHRIIERVQREQRIQYGIKNPRPIIVVTPTYVRTFQTLHLTGLMHSLMLVPYDLVWIVVESGGVSEETASILAKSGLRSIHIGFDERMPLTWDARHRIEVRMRVHALRVVRERRLDGIVMFADDSNMHNMELFDEIQSVTWIGAISVGILAHSEQSQPQEREENLPMPVQGPACNSSGQLAGWHTFNSLPYKDNSATYIDDRATVLPRKLEWAGFVLNSRLVWKDAEDKPLWVRDFDMVTKDGQEIESPLSLLKDASFVEPLGNCGRKILLSWLRVEARADSKFPLRWMIDPPLEIIVPAKRTSWPDVPPELPSENVSSIYDHEEKPLPKTSRISRTRHSSRSKRKHDTQIEPQVSVRSGKGAIETRGRAL